MVSFEGLIDEMIYVALVIDVALGAFFVKDIIEIEFLTSLAVIYLDFPVGFIRSNAGIHISVLDL